MNWPGLTLAVAALGMVATAIAAVNTLQRAPAQRGARDFLAVRVTATVPACILGLLYWLSLQPGDPRHYGYSPAVWAIVCAVATVTEIVLRPGVRGATRLSATLHGPIRYIQVISMLVLFFYDGFVVLGTLFALMVAGGPAR